MYRSQLTAAFTAALVAAALASACADATAQIVPPAVSKDCGQGQIVSRPLPNSAAALRDGRRLRILAIGASSRAVLGRGGRRGGRRGSPLLERLLERSVKGLDVEIVSRGVSGELAEAAAERIMIEVALSAPDIVLWQVGTADAFAHVPIDVFEATVADTVRWLAARDVDVILVGLPYARGLSGDAHYQAIRRSLGRVAAAENVLRIGRYQAMQVLARAMAARDGPAAYAFDPTEAGYNCMAQVIARSIAVGLFAKKK